MSKESENRVNYLLNKYDNQYINGEQLEGKYLNTLKNNYDLQWRVDVLNQLCNECNVKSNVREDCNYWLNKIKTPKFINRTWNLEKCLSVIVFNQLQFDNPDINLKDIPIWRKYNFNYNDYTKSRSRLFREILTNHVILRDPENYFRYYDIGKDD